MADQVRLGVIGTSPYTEGFLLAPLVAHPRADVVALCGRNRERAGTVAGKHGIPAVFTDYREMYARAGLDAVVVASPDDLHRAMTMEALDAGLHVLCEKPMALTLADARTMAARAEATHLKHMVNFSWRTIPEYRYMKELIDEGYIGRPYQCALTFVMSFGRAGDYLWRFDRRRSNGVLGDSASHMGDLAYWLVGDIGAVSALLGTLVVRPGPEGGVLDPANDAATLALRFADGAQGTIQVSYVAHLGDRMLQQRVVIHGEQGTLEADLDASRGAELRGARGAEPQIKQIPVPERLTGRLESAHSPFEQFLHRAMTQPIGARAFVDAIVEDHPAIPSFADGMKAQAVIEAALRSAETGCVVAVEGGVG
jgi:predicted dehydrogenase